jgi:hypothetical protein
MDDEDVAEIKVLLREIRARQDSGISLPPTFLNILKAAGVRLPFQISVKSALLTTFWVAVWFDVIAVREPSGDFLTAIWLYLLIMPPAAALGSALGQPLPGFMYGSASGVAIALWSFAVN